MRIAQVSPLYEAVPPKLYGGTERVVSYLTEELVRQGHDVTLFASGDSLTRAELVSPCNSALRLNPECKDPLVHHFLMLEQLVRRASDFDVIHFHIDYLHFPLSRRLRLPQVSTLHGRLDLPDLVPLYREFRDMPVVSISDSQRRPIPWANWQATVYHGVPRDLYRFCEPPGKYLAFLGRISPEKRLDRAIEIAKRVGMPLRIAAKVDNNDREYFEESIAPLLEHPLIEFIGEIGEQEKNELLGNAFALLFPIDWPEPFGLAMIEAMACGTPVIACARGSVPEVVDHGLTGLLIEDVESGVRAVGQVPQLSRRRVRALFERRFSAERMARDYLAVYRHVCAAAARLEAPGTRPAQSRAGGAGGGFMEDAWTD